MVELPGVSLPSPTRDPSSPPKGSVSQHLHLRLGFQPMTSGGGGHTPPSGCHGYSGKWHTFSGIQATSNTTARGQREGAPHQQALRAAARDPDWEPPRRPPAGADSERRRLRGAGTERAVRGAERPRGNGGPGLRRRHLRLQPQRPSTTAAPENGRRLGAQGGAQRWRSCSRAPVSVSRWSEPHPTRL